MTNSRATPTAIPTVRSIAIVGLGYVGLPTALAFYDAGLSVIGIDTSDARLTDIMGLRVDLPQPDIRRIRRALSGGLVLTSDPRATRAAQAVLIAVPSTVDSSSLPDLSPLTAACESAVVHASYGQRVILATTSYVGTTRDLLINPLEERGLRVGIDAFVGFSPERIDPGTSHRQQTTPRVLGSASDACFEAIVPVVSAVSASIHRVASPEMAEFTKLYENIYRAVNIALANEMADIARSLGLDPMDAIAAASTKPFGFAPFNPGPGVGGHCIPCDPHYLLWQLGSERVRAPLIEEAMAAISLRPGVVVARAAELLASHGLSLRDAHILVVGVAYKPGVADIRNSPALEIIAGLETHGATVAYFDPRVPWLEGEGGPRVSTPTLEAGAFDLVIAHTAHPEIDLAEIAKAKLVLDATYRVPRRSNVFLV